MKLESNPSISSNSSVQTRVEPKEELVVFHNNNSEASLQPALFSSLFMTIPIELRMEVLYYAGYPRTLHLFLLPARAHVPACCRRVILSTKSGQGCKWTRGPMISFGKFFTDCISLARYNFCFQNKLCPPPISFAQPGRFHDLDNIDKIELPRTCKSWRMCCMERYSEGQVYLWIFSRSREISWVRSMRLRAQGIRAPAKTLAFMRHWDDSKMLLLQRDKARMLPAWFLGLIDSRVWNTMLILLRPCELGLALGNQRIICSVVPAVACTCRCISSTTNPRFRACPIFR